MGANINDWVPMMDNGIRFNNHPNIPNELAGIIVGKRKSGKTCLLAKMLLDDDILDYNHLEIFTKTKNQPIYQMIYHGFKNKFSKKTIKALIISHQKFKNLSAGKQVSINDKATPKQICEFYLSDNPDENAGITCTLSDKISEIKTPEELGKNGKLNLVIFDDCINENQEIMNMYFTRGRHSNANVIYIAQNLIKLDRQDIRTNANLFILFKQLYGDLSRFFRDVITTDKTEHTKFLQKAKVCLKKPYGYIAINTDTAKIKLIDNIFEDYDTSDSDVSE